MDQQQSAQSQHQQRPLHHQQQLEARLDALATYLRFSVFKVQAFRYTVLHTLFFVVISFLGFLSLDGRVSAALRDNAAVSLNQAVAEEARTAGDVADWFVSVLPTLGQLQRPNAESLVVFAPFAQATYRVRRAGRPDVCADDAQLELLQRSERLRQASLCDAAYAALPDPVGTDFTFSWPVSSAALATQTQNFVDTVLRDDTADIEVTAPLFLHASAAITVVHVRYAGLEGITTFHVSSPGGLHLSQFEARVMLPLCLATFILVIVVLGEAVADARLELSVSEKALAVFSLKLFIEVLMVLCALAWLAVVVWLLYLWNAPGPGGLETASEAWTMLQRSADGYHAARNVFAAWYALLFFRSFFYLRFWSRLSVISDTVVSAAPALIGCFLTLVALIVAFAAVGNVLYGHLPADAEFRTLSSSIVFVFIFLYRGGAIAYEPFIDQDPTSATVFFLLLHFWVQIIVLNVIIGVVASAFSAVVTSVDLVAAVTWDPVTVARDWRRFLRRFRTSDDDNGDVPTAAIAAMGVADAGAAYVVARLPLLRHVQRRLRREPGSTTATAEDLMPHALMPGFSLAQRRRVVDRVLYKASKHMGNADGVDRGFKMSLQDSKRANVMEADFWRQARIIQDLYASVCGAAGGGGAGGGAAGGAVSAQLQAEADAVSAAEDDLRRSADLLQEDRRALEGAIAAARGETGSLAAELDGGAPRLASLGAATAQLRAAFDDVRAAVEGSEVNARASPAGLGRSCPGFGAAMESGSGSSDGEA